MTVCVCVCVEKKWILEKRKEKVVAAAALAIRTNTLNPGYDIDCDAEGEERETKRVGVRETESMNKRKTCNCFLRLPLTAITSPCTRPHIFKIYHHPHGIADIWHILNYVPVIHSTVFPRRVIHSIRTPNISPLPFLFSHIARSHQNHLHAISHLFAVSIAVLSSSHFFFFYVFCVLFCRLHVYTVYTGRGRGMVASQIVVGEY